MCAENLHFGIFYSKFEGTHLPVVMYLKSTIAWLRWRHR